MDWNLLLGLGGGSVAATLIKHYWDSRREGIEQTADSRVSAALDRHEANSAERLTVALNTMREAIETANRASLAEFELRFTDRLATRLNGTYIRSSGSTATGAELERRLDRLEKRLE